jgi:GT2 family glycosyltransferase
MSSGDESPVISICIANYNGEKIIGDCIESVLRQKNAPLFEILVHDDASTDNSLEAIERYDAVRLIKSSDNVGFCISNNRMASEARGRFILLLNNDAQLFEDALATLFEESCRHAHEAVLGLPQYDFDTRELIDFGLKLDYFASAVPIEHPSDGDVAMVIGACLWLPLSLWNRIGGFPEWFETIAEDAYLCCYARFLGHRIYVPGKSGFLHMVGHSLGANRRLSLIWDIYIRSQAGAFAGIKEVQTARKIAMQDRVMPFSVFFGGFTAFPQKLRLLFSSGLPKS